MLLRGACDSRVSCALFRTNPYIKDLGGGATQVSFPAQNRFAFPALRRHPCKQLAPTTCTSPAAQNLRVFVKGGAWGRQLRREDAGSRAQKDEQRRGADDAQSVSFPGWWNGRSLWVGTASEMWVFWVGGEHTQSHSD